MPLFPPDRLAAWTAGHWTASPAGAVCGFNPDSRTVQSGQVFVALRTDKRDGHDFLPAAAAAGATGALVARARADVALPQLVVADPLAALQEIARLHRRGSGATTIGITGSAGKTSTKNLLARLLGAPPAVLATEGNLNNFLGVPLTLVRLESGVTRHAVVEAGIFPVAVMVMPIHPAAFGLVMLWQIVFNVAGHTGYEFHPKWLMNTPLRYFVNTPTNHVMHHEKMRGNYGLYFNIWDRLMGTNHPDYESRFREVTSRPAVGGKA